MDFTLTEEQQLLRDSVAGYLGAKYDLESSRAAAKSAAGWQPDVWRGFAEELGILGAALPEEVGGDGGGPIETMVIAEELGRALVVEPFVDTVVLGGGLLSRAGGERASNVLRDIVLGKARVAFASLEADSGAAPLHVGTSARRDEESWVIDGAKVVVVGVPAATHLVVSARTSGERLDEAGISLFLTEFDAAAPPEGVRVHAYRTIDDRAAADLEFIGFRLPADALLGAEGEAGEAISAAVDAATAAICAEAVGCLRKVLSDTVEYAKRRHQFGVPIGSFQVLQHRMVDMYLELEQSVAAAHLAAHALTAAPPDRARAVSAAKATIARAARFVGQNAVQLHGAMGMTEELAIGHYFKRLTALEREHGTADHHRTRYAHLTHPRRASE